MTGGGTPTQRSLRGIKSFFGGKDPEPIVPPELDPSPQPIPGREEEEAKKKARRRAVRGGRQSTIFAGLLNTRRQSQSNNILKTTTG